MKLVTFCLKLCQHFFSFNQNVEVINLSMNYESLFLRHQTRIPPAGLYSIWRVVAQVEVGAGVVEAVWLGLLLSTHQLHHSDQPLQQTHQTHTPIRRLEDYVLCTDQYILILQNKSFIKSSLITYCDCNIDLNLQSMSMTATIFCPMTVLPFSCSVQRRASRERRNMADPTPRCLPVFGW